MIITSTLTSSMVERIDLDESKYAPNKYLILCGGPAKIRDCVQKIEADLSIPHSTEFDDLHCRQSRQANMKVEVAIPTDLAGAFKLKFPQKTRLESVFSVKIEFIGT